MLLIPILFIIYKIYGYRKQDTRFIKITTQISLIVILCFVIFSSLSGLYFGFSKSPFSINLKDVFSSILTYFVVIFCEELIRYILSNNNKILFIISSLLFLVFDIFSIFKSDNGYIFFVVLTTLIIPYILCHLLCIYFCYYRCFLPGFIFRFFFYIYPLILPVYPSLGDYIYSIIVISLPFILYYFSNRYIMYYYRSKKTYSLKTRTWFYIPMYSILFIIVVLISGISKYQILAIGSGSMEPNISYGGVVIFKKYDNKVYKGDVIVFNHDNNLIVHRIIDIDNGVIYTKGDANKEVDPFSIDTRDIVGVVKLDIDYLGFPSVFMSNLLKK